MTEPKTRAGKLDTLAAGLFHWGIQDERLGGFQSDAYAVKTTSGLALIDPLPLENQLEEEWSNVRHIFMTHANHQRSVWRLRRQLGARVYAPVGDAPLEEEPDVRYDEATRLPDGFKAVNADAFFDACYLVFDGPENLRTLFCGDLICHDPGGPYRFPEQPGYFDRESGRKDALRLLALAPTTLCAAHATPSLDGCRTALTSALERSN